MRFCFLSLAILFSSLSSAWASPEFAGLADWKVAVTSGNLGALEQLYSGGPPARVTVIGKTPTQISVDSDAQFWVGLKARRVALNISRSVSPGSGFQQVTFQATIKTAPPGRTVYVVESQLWQQQAGGWRLVAVERTDARKLEQPLSLDEKIYPPANTAREEIHQAVAKAGKSGKRVLVVFGADWCYDCHVLDRALERPDIAPTLKANFEVVHVDVGTGNKNQDLMNQYEVPMSRGIPAIAVLDSTGKLLYSQKNGEF
jgi:Thioredoxin-like